MSQPSRPIRRDTRVFLSAVTRELGSIRRRLKDVVLDLDCLPVVQDHFPPDHREVAEMLRDRIAGCDAVIHVAGRCHGAEPLQRPAGAPRRSYTQLEHDIAVELGKPVYVFLIGDTFPIDPHDPEAPELRSLQQAHRDRLTSTDRLYNPAATAEELERMVRNLRLKVEALEGELQHVDERVAELDERFQAEQRAQEQEREKAEAARQQTQTIRQAQEEFAERFLQQLLSNKEITAEDARQRALKDLPALVHLPLAEIESLIARKIPLRAGEAAASPLDRARAALAEGDYDEVFRASDDQNRQGRELAMLEGTAALARFRQSPSPEWNERALAAFRRAMALADPNSATEWEAWTSASISAASVLDDLARYAEAEPLLRDCLRLCEARGDTDSPEFSLILNNLAELLRATNRPAEAEPLYRRALAIDERSLGPDHPNVAIRLNNLAGLLQDTNRPAEAEPLHRRALAIDERSLGPDHPNVATRLNNLALLLRATNRLVEAEPLFRRALAIDERSLGPDHPDVAIDLNNLAELLQATNRPAEAEPLHRRALAIDERSLGPDHPDVAIDLNNLAGLLRATNRLAEAEPLHRRALAIDERSLGPDHPRVAIDLNNLAGLLRATNRPAEAEPLYRRALAIDERSLGPDHPNVAIRLNNLALLLQATNRLAEAEPLMARGIRLLSRFLQATGHEHPNWRAGIANYRGLLTRLNLSEPEIAARMEATLDAEGDLPPIALDDDREPGSRHSSNSWLGAIGKVLKALRPGRRRDEAAS